METANFDWTNFYSEFADKLLAYKDNRTVLLDVLKREFDRLGFRYPFTESDSPIDDICPFTVFGAFNKGITNDKRIAIMSAVGERLGVETKVPTSLEGVPVLNNLNAWFFSYKADRKPDDISNLWSVFEAAINFADDPSEITNEAFIKSYDKVRNNPGIKWRITLGLYWTRPYSYINLDEKNRRYLLGGHNPFATELMGISNLKKPPSAKVYLDIISVCKADFDKGDSKIKSFPELSHYAWKISISTDNQKRTSSASFLKWFAPIIEALKGLGGSGTPGEVRDRIISDLSLSESVTNEIYGKNKVNKFKNEVDFARNYLVYEGFIDKSTRGVWVLTEKGFTSQIDDEIAAEIFVKWANNIRKRQKDAVDSGSIEDRSASEVRYWMYAAGEGSRKWGEFSTQGIMGIGWDEMGDLRQYDSKDSMKRKMKELYGDEFSYMNAALATWQFANELRSGDIVYVKKGMYKVVGRGTVESDYVFDPARDEYRHIRKVKWTNKGEWAHPGQAVLKTLTDITSYTDYVQKLEALFVDEETVEIIQEEKEIIYEDYTDADFLGEVFMDADDYESLVNLLEVKKNIILQGAPGVGKTFAAKRLAYSIMGKKDTSRVMMVQFHQSYSYEDFIMGYRPTKDGFELNQGPFYQFCKIAQDDNERDYFFIIDEINRGNLSKIFGELLMLIEKDKRGDKLRLLYSNELFSVPKNVYIIGMMNTADRSLAMIDYALRRRFAFFELEPAFDSEGFKAIMVEAEHLKFNALVEQVKHLNNHISEDELLGSGFRIGHSYLCTTDEITDEWLYSVVRYELVPLLNEYWFDEQSKIEQWTNKLYGALND